MNEKILEQILNELKGLNQRIDGVNHEIQGVKSQMNSRFDTIETRMANADMKINAMKEDISDIKESVTSIEQNEPADTMAMLKQIDRKLDEKEYDVQALNKRVFKVESEIERLTKQ